MMISSRFTRWLTLVALAATVAVALLLAPIRPLPPAGSNVVGENRFHVVENDGGSLEAIAKNITSGSGAVAGQPGRRSVRARAGSVLTIPLQTILPDAPRQGIVINLAELRLYYYPPGKNEVTVYPIGIGQLGAIRSHLPWSPPSLISALIPRTPTANIRARYKAQVSTCPPWYLLARIIRWDIMQFAAAYGGVYLLHGTNADFGIGMRVSSGCIRLRDDDIKTLYRVIAGTKVNIINTPIKVSEERWRPSG